MTGYWNLLEWGISFKSTYPPKSYPSTYTSSPPLSWALSHTHVYNICLQISRMQWLNYWNIKKRILEFFQLIFWVTSKFVESILAGFMSLMTSFTVFTCVKWRLFILKGEKTCFSNTYLLNAPWSKPLTVAENVVASIVWITRIYNFIVTLLRWNGSLLQVVP